MNGLKLLIATPAYVWGSAIVAAKTAINGFCAGQTARETIKQCKEECDDLSYRLVKWFRVE